PGCHRPAGRPALRLRGRTSPASVIALTGVVSCRTMQEFDLVVIGSGPAGQKAAIQAAKLGRRVAVIEGHNHIGGVAVNTGTIPSKALREAIVSLGSYRVAGPGSADLTAIPRTVTLPELWNSCHEVIAREIDLVRRHFTTNG